VIDVLNRPLQGWWSPRYGAIYRTPAAAIFGPKVMITNEMAGSGGDLMPWMFRYTHIGTLVGKHTWGSLIGVSQYPTPKEPAFDHLRLARTEPREFLKGQVECEQFLRPGSHFLEGIAERNKADLSGAASLALYRAVFKPGTVHQIHGDVVLLNDGDFA
jgi:hypothetical protein